MQIFIRMILNSIEVFRSNFLVSTGSAIISVDHSLSGGFGSLVSFVSQISHSFYDHSYMVISNPLIVDVL